MTRLVPLAVAVLAAVLAVGTRPARARRGDHQGRRAAPRRRLLARREPERESTGEQRAFRSELETEVPTARIGWRYRLVANGYSLSLPTRESHVGAPARRA